MELNIQLFGGRGASSSISKTQTTKITIPNNISSQQKYKLENIRDTVLNTLYGSTKEDYEIKRFDIRVSELTKNTNQVSVVVETGLKGDEGTLAQSLARERAMIFIGKNGGMKHVQWKNTKLKSTKYLYQAFSDYRSR